MENQLNAIENQQRVEDSSVAENTREQANDQDILENPEKFAVWFENLKNSISSWPEKYFTDKALRNTILVASIPFAVLKAGQLDANAEGVATPLVDAPVISKSVESKVVPARIASEELVFLEEGPQKEVITQRINEELDFFDTLSKPLNDTVGSPVFDFSGHMLEKIHEANTFAESLSETEGGEAMNEKRNSGVKKILNDGNLDFMELAKAFPEILLAKELSVVAHETGHVTEAYKQGATSSSASLSLTGGFARYSGNLANKTAFDAAGINADQKYGDLIADTLRTKDAPSQLMAIMALAAKSDGMFYALATNFNAQKRDTPGNDIVAYSKETNTPISNLAIGLTAGFLLDRDNWQLLRVALGQEGGKLPAATIAPMYELGEHGPRVGIKFRGLF